MNSCPSTRSPLSAKKSSPPSTRRESSVARVQVASASPLTSSPPMAAAASPTVRRMHALQQGLLRFLAVGERVLHPRDLLPGLVPFPGDEDRPLRPRDGDGATDGVATVGEQPVVAVAARL